MSSPAGTSFPLSKKILSVVVSTLFGLATSLLVAYVAWYVLGSSPYSSLTAGLPLGAVVSGAVSACGFWVGGRLMHYRPGWEMLLPVLAVSLAIFMTEQWLAYSEIPLRKGKTKPGFMEYFVSSTEHLQLVEKDRSFKVKDKTPLGKTGWVYAGMEVLGFAAGSGFVLFMLGTLPYCERCARYLTYREKRTRKFVSVDALENCYARTAHLFQAGALQEGVDHFLACGVTPPTTLQADIAFSKAVKGRVILDKRRCRKCRELTVTLKAERNGVNSSHSTTVKAQGNLRIPY